MPLKEITELTIKRSEWLRGEESEESRLFRPRDQKMCCLGFFCVAAGLSRNQISDLESPAVVSRDTNGGHAVKQLLELYDSRLYINNMACTTMMEYNDDPSLSDEERESEISKWMMTLNPPVKVTFVD